MMILLLACVETQVAPEDTVLSTTDDSTEVADDSEVDDTEPQDSEPEPEDLDQDGWPAHEDCDDTDPDVHPGQEDRRCDGVDEDCDGSIDEDTLKDETDNDLGDLTNTEQTTENQYLFPESDRDTFLFYVEDGNFSWFDIEVWLQQVPEDADYAFELYFLGPEGDDTIHLRTVDDRSKGGFEFYNYGGSSGGDDTGWYQVVVYSNSGSSCSAPYQLQLVIGSW